MEVGENTTLAAALTAVADGGTIVMPEGNYSLEEPIIVKDKSFKLVGHSFSNSRRSVSGTQSGPVVLDGEGITTLMIIESSGTTSHSIEIEDIIFQRGFNSSRAGGVQVLGVAGQSGFIKFSCTRCLFIDNVGGDEGGNRTSTHTTWVKQLVVQVRSPCRAGA